MSRWLPRIDAAGASGINPPPSGSGFMVETVDQLDLYVATTGNDANSGTSPAEPLATYDEAVRRINVYSAIGTNNAIIHIASGTYSASVPFRGQILKGALVVIGDGAGQAGDDGFTELLASTAAIAGSGTQAVVTGGGLGVNVFKGKTIEILTGPAAGDRRTIAHHTDTTITPARNFTAAVAATNTFRIVESAINITTTGGTLLADGVGSPGSAFAQDFGAIDDLVGTLYFINLRSGSSGSWRLHGSNAAWLGCERHTNSWVMDADAVTSFGCDTVTGLALIGSTLGAASSTAWAGWGTSALNTAMLLTSGKVYGYLTCSSFQPQQSETLILGGSCITSVAGQAAILFADRDTVVEVLAASAPNIRLESTTGATISMQGSTIGECTLDLATANLVATSGTLLDVRNPTARVSVSSTATGSAPTGIGINASFGARIAVRGAIGLSGDPAGPNDITVDNGTSFGTAGSLAAAGQSRFNGADGSLIVRVS